MKHFSLIFIFFTVFLFAEDTLDQFLDQQMKVEAKLLEQNLTQKERTQIQHEQHSEYQHFFLQYASNKKENLLLSNPYRTQITKLKIRLNSNRQRGYKTALLRDKALLQEYTIRNALRNALNEVLRNTENKSKAFYEDKVDEILLKYFSNYKPLDKTLYQKFSDKHKEGSIEAEIRKVLEKIVLLESVSRTFSAELVENRLAIYRAARLSEAKLFALASTVNKSKIGEKLNPYLVPLNLDSSKLAVIFTIIILILLIQKIIYLIMNVILKHYAVKEEDVNYIHSHITKLFNIIASLFIIQIILVVFFGVDTKSILISKFFAILYIILVTMLIYRSGNILVHLKIEHIQNNKLLRKEVVNLIIKTFNVLIIFVAFIFILYILGVNLTAVLSGLGIGGFAVALAAKDSLANFFGTLNILFSDMFSQGDWIKIDGFEGTVIEIGLRVTTLRTFDNALISIPNATVSNKEVKNWNRRSLGRRIKMKIGVKYDSKASDLKKAISEIYDMLDQHPGIATANTDYKHQAQSHRLRVVRSKDDAEGVKKTLLVFLDEFGSSSINILVYCFAKTVMWKEWLSVKEDVMFKMMKILEENNLEFAFPSMSLYHENNLELPPQKEI
jgi:MscS family membrane protein